MDGFEPKRLLVLDVETTGLRPRHDEVLSLSIIDWEGQTVLDERFDPAQHRRWDSAQAVHGIAPKDVEGLGPLGAHRLRISAILGTASVLVGYNLAFDLAFIAAAGITVPAGISRFDVMREFARVHGLHSHHHPHGRWVSLEDCARHYGLAFTAHSSLEDARATLFCCKRLIEEIESVF